MVQTFEKSTMMFASFSNGTTSLAVDEREDAEVLFMRRGNEIPLPFCVLANIETDSCHSVVYLTIEGYEAISFNRPQVVII